MCGSPVLETTDNAGSPAIWIKLKAYRISDENLDAMHSHLPGEIRKYLIPTFGKLHTKEGVW
jgi:hypothetical protein